MLSPKINVYNIFDYFKFLNALNTATGSVEDIIAPKAKHLDNGSSVANPKVPDIKMMNEVIIIEIIVPKIAYMLIAPKCSKKVTESI